MCSRYVAPRKVITNGCDQVKLGFTPPVGGGGLSLYDCEQVQHCGASAGLHCPQDNTTVIIIARAKCACFNLNMYISVLSRLVFSCAKMTCLSSLLTEGMVCAHNKSSIA